MPGLHDLLPQYACLIDGDNIRHLTPSDVTGIGGNAELAQAAADFHRKQAHVTLPGHRAVAGTNQATLQSLTIRDGVVAPHQHGARQHTSGEIIRDQRGRLKFYDVKGDGTVYKESAAAGPAVTPLPLQHGAVASDPVALKAVALMLRDDEHLGPPRAPPAAAWTSPTSSQPAPHGPSLAAGWTPWLASDARSPTSWARTPSRPNWAGATDASWPRPP